MIIYTASEINTILYSNLDIDDLIALVEYLKDYGHFYPRYNRHWIDDIKLLVTRIGQ